MPPTVPAPTPAPIHDITGPVWFFPYPVWMVIVAAVLALAVIGLVVWLIVRRRPARPLTPKERALAALEALRKEGPSAGSYAFGVRISDTLRTYIRDQYGLDAVTRTSVEFLEALRDNITFSDNEKASLSEFLESVDLLKFARQEADAEGIAALLDVAGRVVQGGVAPQPAVAK